MQFFGDGRDQIQPVFIDRLQALFLTLGFVDAGRDLVRHLVKSRCQTAQFIPRRGIHALSEVACRHSVCGIGHAQQRAANRPLNDIGHQRG